jgi:predicted Fe-Mo cluster-binding NifX family protein
VRILIPTHDNGGLEARPHDHFGSAPCFTLVDTDTEEVEVVVNPGAHHAHGQCRPLQMLRGHRFDAIVCRGMGRRALARLNEQGIDVFVCDRPAVADIARAMVAGQATRLTALEACHGHAHGSRHRHGHRHGAMGTGRRGDGTS